MAQNFRSALNGFNREDVVHYLEYINNKHSAQVNQLTSDADFLRQQLENREDHAAELEELKARCAELEQALARESAEKAALEARCEELQKSLDQAGPLRSEPTFSTPADRELEAYRRAERTERLARERAGLVYRQASAVLEQTTSKVDDASGRIGTIVDQITGQLEQLRRAVDGSRLSLQDAAMTMHQLRINEE